MTVAAGAVGAAIGGVKAGGNRPRLAAPGAVLMTAGLLILWWGLGIFRGESGAGGSGFSKIRGGTIPKDLPARSRGGSWGDDVTMDGNELVRTLRAAGFHGDSLVTAVAVAKAESGWRPAILGDVQLQDDRWGPSVGLFQIRSLNIEDGTGRPRDYSSLLDPAFNARAAFAISQGGTNWRAWSAYTNGAYRRYLAQARELVNAA